MLRKALANAGSSSLMSLYFIFVVLHVIPILVALLFVSSIGGMPGLNYANVKDDEVRLLKNRF